MKTFPSEPCFPVNTAVNPDDGTLGHQTSSQPTLWQFGGLTKREHFASQAMRGLMASPQNLEMDINDLARWAIEYADCLIEELNASNEENAK